MARKPVVLSESIMLATHIAREMLHLHWNDKLVIVDCIVTIKEPRLSVYHQVEVKGRFQLDYGHFRTHRFTAKFHMLKIRWCRSWGRAGNGEYYLLEVEGKSLPKMRHDNRGRMVFA